MNMDQWIALSTHFREKLQQILITTRCRLCRAPGLPGLELCAECRRELPWLGHACRGCALPLPRGTSATHCPDCQKGTSSLDGCDALFSYGSPVDQWIQGLKFHQDLGAARLFGRLLADSLPAAEPEPSISVVPVPLHRKRLSERGYNQALEIARPLSRLGYQLDLRACRRHKATASQSGLAANDRWGNMRAAFTVTQALHKRHFILVDDVLTTGATLNSLARALKDAGAQRVEARVIARTVK